MSAPRPEQPRRPVLLIGAIVAALLAAVVVSALRGSYRDGPLEPDAPTAQGSRAVVRVLEELGADVQVRRHTEDAAQALRAGRTVLVTDPSSLTAEQLIALQDARRDGAGRLVLVRPDAITLSYLDTSIRPSGTVTDPETLRAGAACGPAAFGARRLEVAGEDGALGRSRLYDPGAGNACFGRGGTAGDAGIVAVDGDLVVLGSADVLTNESIHLADDSALALNLLGASGELTWYVPSATDPMNGTGQDLLAHLPPWAGPAAAWLLLSVVLLVLAFARRLGPVVVEPLPVAVRPQEIVLGRARLLQRAGAHDAAAASLRSAAAVRLADRLGLHRTAGLDALLAALAGHTSRSPAQLRDLLGPHPVRTDPELVRLARDLDTLEKEIDR